MKIKSQTAEELVLTDSTKGAFWLLSLFVLIGLYLGYNAFLKHESLIISLFFIIVGMGAILISENRIVRINKSSGKITIQKKSFLRNSINIIDISEVEQVHLHLYPQYSNSVGNNSTNISNVIMMRQLNLYLKNGNSIPLEKATGKMQTMGTNIEDGGQKGVSEGILLSRFLNVPFQIIDSGQPFIPKS
jgi:hypothetical protein